MSKDLETAETWCETISEKMEIRHQDADLIKRLALEILDRWRRAAGKSDDPANAFTEMFVKNKERAQGAIVAILELVQALGDGKAMPEVFKELN